MKKKNVIVYFSDQQRADTIDERVTPNLVRLAKAGVKFNNAHTCQPVCGPARACLQTGIYASENGCFRNDIALNTEAVTIAKLLNGEGYDTAYVGKWHLASNSVMQNYHTKAVPEILRGGYRYWRAADCLEFTSHGVGGYVYDNDGNKVEFTNYRADAINDMALDYLDKRDKEKPFFLFVSQLEPHHQNSNDEYECPNGYGKLFNRMPLPKDIDGLSGNYSKHYANYLGCCKALDDNVQRMVDKLKELGEWDNTVLIYASDHGCHFRTRNAEYKRSCHNASTRIPLIMTGGAVEGKQEHDGIVSLIDIPSTILKEAGIDIPEHFRGNALSDYISGLVQREYAFVEISESQLGRAIITDRYTYSVRKRRSLGLTSANSKMYIEDKLYDNVNDPYQKRNLVRDGKLIKVRDELREILLKEIENVSGYRPKIKQKLTSFRSQP